jgi:hypothetical protein
MNQFSKSEKELVDSIVVGLHSINWYGNNSAINDYVERMACKGVKKYIEGASQHIAALSIIQLVKERLYAQKQ